MTTDFDESDSSPHYFIDLDRQYPELNLILRMTQCDDVQAFVRAHKAVQWLAAQDEDHAQLANGKRFLKADTKFGSKLASLRVDCLASIPLHASS
jgi:hypothetical protein